VKNGSKMYGMSSLSIPAPLSLTASRMYEPGLNDGCRCASSASTGRVFPFQSVSVPPRGIASLAFTARFTST
jgi:hypothetical protein